VDRQPVPWARLEGRERFVDALLPLDGAIVAGTHRGAIVLSDDGTRRETWAPGETVTALALVEGEPLVGTPHGLYRRDRRLELRGPDGEPIRVTALATAAARLYLGSPAGLYSLPLPLLQAAPAEWQPLVFGTPGARSNVVTALAPIGDGVLAGTDDAGVAFVSGSGVRALAFDDPGANDVNPGAMTVAGGGVVVGTQGGGLVRVTLAGASPRGSRPRGWPLPRVSAVGERFIGSDDGRVFAVACAAASCPMTIVQSGTERSHL
jgi:hypothetical protein